MRTPQNSSLVEHILIPMTKLKGNRYFRQSRLAEAWRQIWLTSKVLKISIVRFCFPKHSRMVSCYSRKSTIEDMTCTKGTFSCDSSTLDMSGSKMVRFVVQCCFYTIIKFCTSSIYAYTQVACIVRFNNSSAKIYLFSTQYPAK